MANFCGVALVALRQGRLRRGGQRRRWRRAGKHTKKRQSACVSDFLVHSGTLLFGKPTIYYCQGLPCLFFCFLGFFKFFVVVVGFCFDVDHFWSLDWMCLGGFPGGTVVKNLSAVQETHAGSIPGSGRSPAGGHGNSLQYSCLESPTDGGAWQLQSTASQRVEHN